MDTIPFFIHVLPLFQHMLVFLGLAYLFTKTPVFTALVDSSLTLPDKAIIYLVFAGFSILGTVFSEPSSQIPDAIANTRAIGAVVGGLLGGPLVGFLVGLTGGLFRLLSLSCDHNYPWVAQFCGQNDPVNYIDWACVVATALEGLFAGYIHYFQSRKGKIETVFIPQFVLMITLLAEFGHMLIILLFGGSEHLSQAISLISEIAPPMLIANSIGAALIIYMIREQKQSCDIISSSAIAWRIANKTADSMFSGFRESSQSIAQIIQQETQVSAVSITDTETILAFTGLGSDHHLAGTSISNDDTRKVIASNQVIFSNGIENTYQCRVKKNCPIGSALVIPLASSGQQVFGTIKLYEAKNKLFQKNNITLGKQIAELLSTRFILGGNEQRKNLETQEQLKLLRAQIKPHFLYNSLATISAIIKPQPEKARDLLLNLSDFFRANLKTPENTSTLREEYKHLQSYLKIEKARFQEQLMINIDFPDELMEREIPVFTLQPIVENAVEHGTSQRIQMGIISISCIEQDNALVLTIEDNAGKYKSAESNGSGIGIGLTLDKRIRLLYGNNYGISVECQADRFTKFIIRLPNRKI